MKLDQLFKSKLENLDYEYKPEYWTEMKEKLKQSESASGSSGSIFWGNSLARIYKASIITLSIVLLGTASYYIFNNPDSENITETSNNNGVTEKARNINNDSQKIQQVAPQPTDISTTEDLISTKTNTREEKTIYTFKAIPFNFSPSTMEYVELKNNSKPCVFSNQKLIDIDTIAIEYDPFEINTPEDRLDQKPNEEPKMGNKLDVEPKEKKNIRPMQKPVKQVFKKRKGLLWYLGFRR